MKILHVVCTYIQKLCIHIRKLCTYMRSYKIFICAYESFRCTYKASYVHLKFLYVHLTYCTLRGRDQREVYFFISILVTLQLMRKSAIFAQVCCICPTGSGKIQHTWANTARLPNRTVTESVDY